MARQIQAVEVNKFNAGLITDASPLTSPDNSCIDEQNMTFNIDGSSNRRYGMDFEPDYSEVETTIEDGEDIQVGTSTYRWRNAGGDPEKSIQVVQFGNQIKFFDLDIEPLSDGLIFTYDLSATTIGTNFSYAVVDGILVAVTGLQQIFSFVFTAPGTINLSSARLLIRDFFGVEDLFGGKDITRGTEVQDRPTSLTDRHLYNLRNQSWGIPRIIEDVETLYDPVDRFFTAEGTHYPSNSDSVTEVLYPDPEDVDNRTIDRFFATDLILSPLGTARAPLGYFIIDALNRGESRLTQDSENRVRYPLLDPLPVTTLPLDRTPRGAVAIAEFAGRVWYGGFPGDVEDGDRYSPKMSSYILFSKVVESPSDINICYQEGDPTSKVSPDIVDTDGGFIRINEAYGIQKLINLGSSLMVVASNGIWRVVGGDNGFTATSYIVERISSRGSSSPDSITVIDNNFMFWGDDAIYHVTVDQYGSWVCNNISFGRIQRLFDSIPSVDKKTAVGGYDSYERKVRWLYYNRTNDDTNTEELVLDLQLQAFSTNTIQKYGTNNFPRVVSMTIGNPYTVIGHNISQRELNYIIVTAVEPYIKYSFGTYRNEGWRDWYSVDNVGVDADAYLVTSYMSGNDFQRDKGVPYITVHLRRTEDGYDVDMNPTHSSSCLMQARWGWSNSDFSGKWGREFQAYRYRVTHIPTDEDDPYDTGFAVISSRNKLRGSGKVLSIKFRTEPDKDLHLYGWSMLLGVSENV